MGKRKKGFTLIEIGIGLGLVAILSTAVVLAVNPSEIFKKSRDAQRVSDIAKMTKAVEFYKIAHPGQSLGAAYTVYVSIPASNGSCPAGLPALDAGWTYHCADATSYMNADGTGWLPINFNATLGALPNDNQFTAQANSSLPSLPVDPATDAAVGLYYRYIAGSGGFELISEFESLEMVNKSAKDGGGDDLAYESGPNLSLWTIAKGSGLVGFWKFDEVGGTTATDSSGNGNNGTLVGTRAGFAPGKIGNALEILNEQGPTTDSYVNVPPSSSLNNLGPMSVAFWMKPTACCSSSPREGVLFSKAFAPSGATLQLYFQGFGNNLDFIRKSTSQTPLEFAVSGVSMAKWYLNWNHVVIIWDGVFGSGSSGAHIYINGVEQSYSISSSGSGSISDDSNDPFLIGSALAGAQNMYPSNSSNPPKFTGLIDEMRVYHRALTSTEAKQLYFIAP